MTLLTDRQIGWSHLGVLITSLNWSWSHLEKHLPEMGLISATLVINPEAPGSGEQELQLFPDPVFCESRKTPAFCRSYSARAELELFSAWCLMGKG